MILYFYLIINGHLIGFFTQIALLFFFIGVVQLIKNVAMYESPANDDGDTLLTGTSQLQVPIFEHQS